MNDCRDNFERNNYEGFVRVLNDLGALNQICLGRNDVGPWGEWNVEYVQVMCKFADKRHTAPFNGWMPVNKWICRGAS